MPRQRRDPWFDRRKGTDVYYVFWYDAAARQRRCFSLGTSSHVEAAQRFAAFLSEGRAVYQPERQDGLRVNTALADYDREHVEPHVVDKIRARDAIRHLEAFFGDQLCRDLTIEASVAYAEARRSGAVGSRRRGPAVLRAGDGTIRREITVLAAALKHAVKRKRLTRDEWPWIEKPKANKRAEAWLFADELAALRAAANWRTQAYIDLAYWTAGRRRSIETLTVFQVSIPERRINLAPAGDHQTNKRRPVLPIPDELFPALERMVAEATQNGREHLLGHSGSTRTAFMSAAKRAGVYELPARSMRPAGRITQHILRHSRATHMLQAGVPLWAVAGLLGDTEATVRRTYGHHCPEYLEAALKGVNR